jgi:glycosyltransferase involved in cell wall biosynthesis
VYLASTLRRAGPTSQLLNIVRYLDPRQFDPVVITLSPEPAASMLESFSELGVEVKSQSMSRLRAVFHRGWRRDIERLVGARLDDLSVIHSHGVRSDVISSRHLVPVPRVATVRNFPYEDYVMKFGPLLGRWMAWTHLRAFRALPVVVACSSTLSETLREHGLETAVIRNGVDTSKFRAALPGERARLRSELGLAADARIGLCVGALTARKDPLSIVQAVRAIDDQALTLVFVGSGNLEASSRRAARGDERIRFVGQIDDVAHFLRAADFFVSASRAEGLPNAALEAIACGLRVVLSDIGPHREVLELVPSAGDLFAPGDRQALSAAIGRAASRTAAAAGLAPESVEELVGAEQMSRRYQELYLRLVSEAASS